MQVGIMATDGGPHPPAKWARTTAAAIMDHVGRRAPLVSFQDAQAFEEKVFELLARHHALAQDHEKAALITEGTERLASPVVTSGHVPDAVDDIVALAKGTTLEAHFNSPGQTVDNGDGTATTILSTRAFLERLLHEHFHHSMLIERSWHADAHLDHPYAVAFKTIQNDGHVALTGSDDPHDDKGGREVVHAVMQSMVPGEPAARI